MDKYFRNINILSGLARTKRLACAFSIVLVISALVGCGKQDSGASSVPPVSGGGVSPGPGARGTETSPDWFYRDIESSKEKIRKFGKSSYFIFAIQEGRIITDVSKLNMDSAFGYFSVPTERRGNKVYIDFEEIEQFLSRVKGIEKMKIAEKDKYLDAVTFSFTRAHIIQGAPGYRGSDDLSIDWPVEIEVKIWGNFPYCHGNDKKHAKLIPHQIYYALPRLAFSVYPGVKRRYPKRFTEIQFAVFFSQVFGSDFSEVPIQNRPDDEETNWDTDGGAKYYRILNVTRFIEQAGKFSFPKKK